MIKNSAVDFFICVPKPILDHLDLWTNLIYLHDFCLKLIHGVKLYRIRFASNLHSVPDGQAPFGLCHPEKYLYRPTAPQGPCLRKYRSQCENNRRLFLHTVQRIYRLAKLQNQNKKEHMSTQDITILNILFLDILSSPYRFLSAY